MADLEAYRRKRDFGKTPEPEPERRASDASALSYVMQRHHARALHYDFRLEHDGVLLSWAVPKGPSLDPGVKRLAVRTEDHPLDYGGFEGVIPKGEYGAGSVLLWDRGRWRPRGDVSEGLAKGRLVFELEGERLRGGWTLVRTARQQGDKEQWLLIKRRDDSARPGDDDGVTRRFTTSVATGRDQTGVAEERERVWGGAGEIPGRGELLALEGARARRVPWPLSPELPTLAARPVEGEGWLHELKLDGYRILVRKAGGEVRLCTRSGLDWTPKLGSVAQALWHALPVEEAVLDGEIVWLGADGRCDFPALQRSIGRDDPNLFYVAFDLLQLGDVDLRELPLARRKDLLARLIPTQGRVRYGAHVEGRGADVLARACELGVEGVVSKRASAPYRSGRSRNWTKVKCHGRDDFVVIGFLVYHEPLSSLLLAQEDADGLRYVGRVGTGFSDKVRRDLRDRLDPLVRRTPPARCTGAPKGVRWVQPQLRVDVRFTGWTDAGQLRHASFQGIREEQTMDATLPSVRITHPDRVIYPDEGVTKGDLAAYYARVAHLILPHVARRPLTLLRCPGGIDTCFHQKHLQHLPKAVRPVDVGSDAPYLWIDDPEGLLALIQHGVVEIHPWGSRVDRLDKPDRLVLDLDPDEDLPWEALVNGAFELRALLEELGLTSFAKLTGGKGVHVVVPIRPRLGWDAVKSFAKAVADELVRRAPGRYTATLTKKKREGRIFVDYLRNAREATAVSAWSARARPGATLARTLPWRALDPDTAPERPRLDRFKPPPRDPWGDLDQVDQAITADMRKRLQPPK